MRIGVAPDSFKGSVSAVDAALSMDYASMPLEQCMREGSGLIEHAAERPCRVLKAGMRRRC